ncbi:bifunctional 4-hydroxy-2-oxoglutarate aldolase/2-dehydro-3-deoxy-phosphogluconate aldolase [Paractinoplanes lichenicola]|uniref:2-dehydro-3-deoxy-phosphogluconate aldolase n=1 Tax=Paractinoplanes lichenicola TaxID=2802976 RepID=A0ABS1VVR0_9ACTN|nr:bifunctional 4-hydroxy-2-oxoglutarate aldolase/2-dehydro-3-deoxy-phosphogluconate aldolase [Actinoplanes lichenicola]MBL7258572.1 bifunctional 4-hydroxy-2-oxoglutarate aldolase/2-dehydro-3-deoxy-phosphogluconate aldolase [Actinoplanes lichenicola]
MSSPILPVVVLDDPGQAVPLGEALLAGGIDSVEITLRTAAGLEGIRHARTVEGLRVGAGSVLTPSHVDQVVEAGAEFIVCPGLSAAVVERAREHGVDILPGVATPSELMAAVALGLDEVKLFPAGLLGGPAYIEALSAPFPAMRFVPSGGVSLATLRDYLAVPAITTVSGTWMVARKLLAAGDWARVTALSAEAIAAV